jgi:hypothetical protein
VQKIHKYHHIKIIFFLQFVPFFKNNFFFFCVNWMTPLSYFWKIYIFLICLHIRSNLLSTWFLSWVGFHFSLSVTGSSRCQSVDYVSMQSRTPGRPVTVSLVTPESPPSRSAWEWPPMFLSDLEDRRSSSAASGYEERLRSISFWFFWIPGSACSEKIIYGVEDAAAGRDVPDQAAEPSGRTGPSSTAHEVRLLYPQSFWW